ncbi:MAG TPA: ribosome silencing factor [Blastocatellia bacterium]|nr:ribosome silencing factor [Blastocatellia bacterium]
MKRHSTSEKTESRQRSSIEPEAAVMLAAHAATEKKATDLVLLDLRKIASFTEYFLICSGASSRQVQAVSNAIEETLLKRGKRPLHIEGYSSAEWILLDYGDFIVHVFSHASRKFYDLERLWRDARRVEVKDEGGELKTEERE